MCEKPLSAKQRLIVPTAIAVLLTVWVIGATLNYIDIPAHAWYGAPLIFTIAVAEYLACCALVAFAHITFFEKDVK